ncbi:hypothetical protein [Rhizorhabdus wittichii]|uniref:hypothetical protein n=1 Tax=Rhizorhabdus wittichii TaxID=160791 RepID=UPI0012FE0E1E|nr:hypothetical protein [Rhizorhabdus wittichii]
MASQPWQTKFARPDWRDALTRLTPDEEQIFLRWAAATRSPVTDDYDMRGFWKNGDESQMAVNPNDGMIHYPDTWKTPLHQSFSGESIYANHAIPQPVWNDKDQLVAPDGTVLYDERAVARARKAK